MMMYNKAKISREKGRLKTEQRFVVGGSLGGSLLQWRDLKLEFSKIYNAGLGGVGGGGALPPRHGQFCRRYCSVLVVAGVSLFLSVQSFRNLIMQVGGGSSAIPCDAQDCGL